MRFLGARPKCSPSRKAVIVHFDKDGQRMRMRTRKLVGIPALLLIIFVYAIVAMIIGVRVLPNASAFIEFAYYLFAGLAWVFPAGLIIRWMSRSDPQ